MSCSTTKFVSDGQYLLDKVEIKIDNPGVQASDMTQYLQHIRITKYLVYSNGLYTSITGRVKTKING